MSSRLILLIKLLNQEYLEPLQQQGLIHMKSINYFRDLKNDNERGDSYENITNIFQPVQVTVKVNHIPLTYQDHYILLINYQ